VKMAMQKGKMLAPDTLVIHPVIGRMMAFATRYVVNTQVPVLTAPRLPRYAVAPRWQCCVEHFHEGTVATTTVPARIIGVLPLLDRSILGQSSTPSIV